MFRLMFTAFAVVSAAGCANSSLVSPVRDAGDLWETEAGLEIPIDREYGKPLLHTVPDYRSVGYDYHGPATSGLSTSTEVWTVTRRWYHTDAAAGLAWDADSGLTWDEKYAAWVDSLEQTSSESGYATVQLTTPWGKELPSPALECAEMAMFLRATFAAWYELPFFLSAWHPSLGSVHYGHFGVVDANGNRVSGTPTYARSYSDYTASWSAGQAWPKDESLRAKSLTTAKDDAVPFLGDDAYAGAYFDEVHLNKRAGHFLLKLLTNFGSIHLASAKNTWNLEPANMRSGDVLVERWQSQGIGHVMVVKEVTELGGGNLDAEIVFGSMPRIQVKWYEASIAKSYFTSQYSGGPDEDSSGTPYARYGGGLKRWRTPVSKNGHWVNIVPVADRDAWIGSTNYAALGDRIATLQGLLGNLTPAEEREVILERITLARNNLRQRPASCANRQRREEAFDALYALNAAHFGKNKAQTDAETRIFEDYVFAELDYGQAKTCCWNSTTPAMHEIIMDLNEELVADANANGQCIEPEVFKAVGGDYSLFADYADETGRGNDWVAWSEDETCPQRDVVNDKEAPHAWSDFCDVADDLGFGSAGSSTPQQPSDPCGGITYDGICDGNTVVWCEGGELYEYDCGANTCGWDDYWDYNWCL